MNISEIEKHKFIKLIKFALAHENFSIEQAMDASGMTKDEFSGAKFTIFQLKGIHEQTYDIKTELCWRLSANAFFNYLSFLEYRDALRATRRAFWISIASLVVAIGSVIYSVSC